ncbi:MAG: hypothetical protein ACXAEU_06865 [Candidatus Hodarchaeales archaeon]|jgi:hypothetical protein
MTGQDELLELVQTSLKVMAKDIGDRLKEFDKRIVKLEQTLKDLSNGSLSTPVSFDTPQPVINTPSSPQAGSTDTPSFSTDPTPSSSASSSGDDEDKKKKDLMDAMKIIDSI